MTLSRFQHLRRVAMFVLIVVAFVALLVVRSAGSQATHDLIEAIGLGLIVAGILGRLWCTLYIGGRKASEIVDVGPYSVTRNPLYLFSSIAAAGVGAQAGSVVLAGVFFLGCALAFHVVIRREEGYLAETFGEPYRAYMQRVPRFWPSVRLFRDQKALTVATDRIYRTFTDGLVFFVAKPAFEFVEHLQNEGVLVTLLRIY